jgi:hypothetical protein
MIRKIQKVRKDFQSAVRASCECFSTRSLQKEGLMARKMKITFETDSLLIVRGRNAKRAWCPRCAAEGEMIALENAGVISNLKPAALDEWLNSGELHLSQAADGSALICLNSLLARVQNTKAD